MLMLLGQLYRPACGAAAAVDGFANHPVHLLVPCLSAAPFTAGASCLDKAWIAVAAGHTLKQVGQLHGLCWCCHAEGSCIDQRVLGHKPPHLLYVPT